MCVVGHEWAWRFTQASHAANSFSVLQEVELLMGSFHIFWLSGFRYSTEIGNMWHVVSYAPVVSIGLEKRLYVANLYFGVPQFLLLLWQ